jgi:hypothetical protein
VAGHAGSQTIKALADTYHHVRDGLGFNKSPREYGAFPTDPYSHTPGDGGARQPGMTGQVKEEILTRLGELGVSVSEGMINFEPTLLRVDELLPAPGEFSYLDVQGEWQTIPVPANSLAFTFCQVPVIYTSGAEVGIAISFAGDQVETHEGTRLDLDLSQHIFARDGHVQSLLVTIDRNKLYRPQ